MVGILYLGTPAPHRFPSRDDKQGGPAAVRVQQTDGLSAGKLENDGIQGPLPSEKQSGHRQHHRIARQNIVPGIDILPFGQGDSNKISTSAGGSGPQAEADRETGDQAAEHTDQQQVLCNGDGRHQVSENADQDNTLTGIEGKLLSQMCIRDRC